MPALESFVNNGEYYVGCSGQTVYVYDKNGNELARFKDIKYAYTAVFSPTGDIFAVKSTNGRMAVYSLKELKLIKKFRYSKLDGGQDENFCFSPDGKKLYNIEDHRKDTYGFYTALSVYNTEDFSLKKRLLDDDYNINLKVIEYDDETECFFVLCAKRNANGCYSEYFIAKLIDDKLSDIVFISPEDSGNYYWYKKYQTYGYTNKKEDLLGKSFTKEFLSDIDFHSLNLRKLAMRYTQKDGTD